MKGWIFYSKDRADLPADNYEIRRIVAAAEARGIEIDVIRPDRLEMVVGEHLAPSLYLDQEPVELPDFVLPRQGATTSYFTLSLLRFLAQQGVKVLNSADAIALCGDKMQSAIALAHQGVPMPAAMLARFPVDTDAVIRKMGMPLVLKTRSGSQGTGVMLMRSESQFKDMMQLMGNVNPKAEMMFQRYVQSSHGRDIRVIVVGGKVVSAMVRQAAEGEFKANVHAGGTTSPQELTPELVELSVRVATLLNLDIAGLDFLCGEDGHYLLCEANSSPGFKGMEAAHPDMNMAEVLVDLAVATCQR